MKNKIKLYFIYIHDGKGKKYALYYSGQGIIWYRMRRLLEANLFRSKQGAYNYIIENGLEENGIRLKVGCLKSNIVL